MLIKAVLPLDTHGDVLYMLSLYISGMDAATTPQATVSAPPLLLDKAFFGKDNCITVQVRKDAAFLKWGRKSEGAWVWKNVKFADVELGEILRVLSGATDEASFFHSFQGESTKIWVSRQQNAVVLRADDFTKGLQPGEQEVLGVLLRNAIWLMNLG